MTPSPESSDAKWTRLAARARGDTPPPLDVSAALRAARAAAAAGTASTPERSWLVDFAALFATPRRLAACGSFAALALIAAVWLSAEAWTQLEPWADLVGSALEDSL